MSHDPAPGGDARKDLVDRLQSLTDSFNRLADEWARLRASVISATDAIKAAEAPAVTIGDVRTQPWRDATGYL